MSNLGKYYLSSLDSYYFEKPRECQFLKQIVLESGKKAVIAKVDPPITGQNFNRNSDIDIIILTHRHQGYALFPIRKFPCFVFITLPLIDDALDREKIDSSELEIIAWGELYRTLSDAENHVFET
jgi:hypothetical protein